LVLKGNIDTPFILVHVLLSLYNGSLNKPNVETMLLRYIFFPIILIFLALSNATAQENTSETGPVISPWTKSWVVHLNGNQANYKNWSQGGVNSVSFLASTLFRVKYQSKKVLQYLQN